MATASARSSTNWADQTKGRWFYLAMAIAALLVSIASFAPSLLDTSARRGTFTWVTLVHSVLFSAWLVVFILQTWWARARKLQLHRKLGSASLGLAAAMVIVGYATTLEMAWRGFDLSGDLRLTEDGPSGPIAQMIFPLLDITEFGLLVAIGYLFRQRAAIHKRLMLFATVALLPAPFAHLIGHFAWLREMGPLPIEIMLILSLFASAGYDLIRFRRIHPVSLWLALAMFVAANLCAIVIGPSEAWHRFGTWLISY